MLKIGFMQGRFSDVIDGKIQAFPWINWKKEFYYAEQYGFKILEWTLDADERLYENPLMTKSGRATISELSNAHDLRVQSLTADCFMQAPFYKSSGGAKEGLLTDFRKVIEASALAEIKLVVIPLVDNGRIENLEQENSLYEGIQLVMDILKEKQMSITFESDFNPQKLKIFIDSYPETVGINYDIGNSASLGYNAESEISEYGHRILNVHVKDRLLGGTTVPLGEGNANLPYVFNELKKIGYSGNYILQTARAKDGNHADLLAKYKKMVEDFLE